MNLLEISPLVTFFLFFPPQFVLRKCAQNVVVQSYKHLFARFYNAVW